MKKKKNLTRKSLIDEVFNEDYEVGLTKADDKTVQRMIKATVNGKFDGELYGKLLLKEFRDKLRPDAGL